MSFSAAAFRPLHEKASEEIPVSLGSQDKLQATYPTENAKPGLEGKAHVLQDEAHHTAVPLLLVVQDQLSPTFCKPGFA